jgi:acetyl esterase/lipase
VISLLDTKAYALRVFFNSLGRLGGLALNFGCTKSLDVFADVSYGSDKEQRLDIFRPRGIGNDSLPVLVFFHGGGWISANKKIYEGVAATFSRSGFLTFNVNYRLAPKHRFSAPLRDAARAIDWIDHNAVRYGGDRSAIVLAGDSAGAQIASWYASALHNRNLLHLIETEPGTKSVSVKGLLLFYGVFDFDAVLQARFPFIKTYARSFLGSDPQTYEKHSRLASPIKQISRDLPPVWLCAGEKDGLFSQSKAYADALKKHGVTCRTLFFSSDYRASHGFLFLRWLRSSQTAIAHAVEFVRDCADESSIA